MMRTDATTGRIDTNKTKRRSAAGNSLRHGRQQREGAGDVWDSTPKSFSFVEPIDLVPWMRRTPLWQDAPAAPAIFVPRQNQPHPWEWRVVLCPYCDDGHRHRSGFNPPMPDDDPRMYLGGRKAHCYQYNDEYLRVEYRLVPIEIAYFDRQELRRFFPRATKARLPHSDVEVTIKIADDISGIEIIERTSAPIRQPIPRELRAAVWQKTFGRCYLCGVLTNPFDDLHIDHLQPVTDGGTNDLANLWPACATCNQQKHAMSLEAFRARRGGGLFWFEVARMGGAS